jgi:hypothetical protein
MEFKGCWPMTSDASRFGKANKTVLSFSEALPVFN